MSINTLTETKVCHHCHAENKLDAAQCVSCQRGFRKSCKQCGKPLVEGHKFCGHCGNRVTEALSPELATDSLQVEKLTRWRQEMPASLQNKINQTQDSNLGERREVTILLLDLADFTATSHVLDNEEMFVLVDEAMHRLVKVVYEFEGHVDKFTGDGLRAMFGAPITHENDPELAVIAAQKMQESLLPLQKRMREEFGVELLARIGINTGMVIAGKVGNDMHMEYTVIGSTVKNASILESYAEPGTVLVSQSTYDRTRSQFSYRIMPSLVFNNGKEVMPAFRPIKEKRKTKQDVRSIAPATPLIGRQSQLACLYDALKQVEQNQQGHLVLITGEAGVGKSRLIAEFIYQIDSQMTVFQGDSQAHNRSRPYWIIANLLRDLLQILPNDKPSQQFKILSTFLTNKNLEHTLPYLANILELDEVDSNIAARLSWLSVDMRQHQTQTALRQFLFTIFKNTPTVIVLEDLHWIDPASREFLNFILQTPIQSPILLLLVSREFEHTMQLSPIIATIHEYKGKLDHIKLEHLTDSETHALVTHLVPQNSTGTEQLKQKIVERSEGNPLYAEEIVRMLLEEQRKNQSYDNQSTASTLSFLENIPSTLAGLILARFDSFPLDTRKTLQHAAIIGRTFPVSLLQLLENDSTKNIQQQLAQATESQFIQFLPNNGEDYYAFRHAIFQAVIYQTMLRRDREFIHEKIAQIIEYSGYQLGASFGNFNEILAYHYGKSVQPELAIPYYIASAENAARHSAHESAIKYFRKALALMDTDSLELNTELARVNINLGESLKFTGELQKAKEVLNKILQKMPFWGIRLESSLIFLPIFIHGLRELADVCIQSGEYEEATTHLKAGIEALGDDGEREYASLWRSLVERLAFVYLSQGNPADSFNLAKSATAGMDHEFADEPVLLAQLFNIMGGSSWLQGDLLHGIHYVEKSLQLYEAAGYTRGISQAHTNLGTLYFRQGKWPNAVENLEKGLKTSNEIGDIPSQVIILSNLGNLRLAMGEHNLARQALMKSLSLRQQLGYVYALEQTNNALSRLALVEGDFKNALEFALIGQQMGIKTGSKLIELHALRLLALLDLHEERYEEATQKIMGIVAQANAGNLYVIEADCFRVLAHIHLQNGANEEAETVLLQAIKYYQDQNDSYYLGHSFFGLGCVYTVTHVDNPEQGKTYLRKAEAIFRVLGAKHDRKITQQILTREDALRCVNYAY